MDSVIGLLSNIFMFCFAGFIISVILIVFTYTEEQKELIASEKQLELRKSLSKFQNHIMTLAGLSVSFGVVSVALLVISLVVKYS